MLWSVIRLIFKTSSVTPDFFYVFNLILPLSTCSQSFKKICTWERLGANLLKVFDRQSSLGAPLMSHLGSKIRNYDFLSKGRRIYDKAH